MNYMNGYISGCHELYAKVTKVTICKPLQM